VSYGPPSKISWFVCPTCGKSGTTHNPGHMHQLTGKKCIDRQVQYIYTLSGKAEGQAE